MSTDNLEDLREKIFFECKNIIDTLTAVGSAEEILSKKDLVEELNERISFLKVLEKHEEYFMLEAHASPSEFIPQEIISQHLEDSNPAVEPQEEHLEEEVLFTNELNEFDIDEVSEEIEAEEREILKSEELLIQPFQEVMPIESELKETIATNDHPPLVEDQVEKTKAEVAIEKVEEEKNNPNPIEVHKSDLPFKEDIKEEAEGKRFKLSHIKGLGLTGSLFDDEPEQALKKEEISLVKSNIPTDYMEAEKPKPGIRLDLNDKIAFSKNLFGGSQSELNDLMRILNNFTTLEQSKEYLSEIYYLKHWEKVDEIAQRLWTLVENRFS